MYPLHHPICICTLYFLLSGGTYPGWKLYSLWIHVYNVIILFLCTATLPWILQYMWEIQHPASSVPIYNNIIMCSKISVIWACHMIHNSIACKARLLPEEVGHASRHITSHMTKLAFLTYFSIPARHSARARNGELSLVRSSNCWLWHGECYHWYRVV